MTVSTKYDPDRGNRIPLAREELMKVEDRLRSKWGADDEADTIKAIRLELMTRNKTKKPVARARQNRITPQMVRGVLDYVKANPKLHNRDIGRRFGIDGGRVSEILQGQRTEAYPAGTPEWKR